MTKRASSKSIAILGFGIIFALFGGLFLSGVLDDLVPEDNADGEIRLRPDNAELVDSGRQVYADYCAACHGANLEGEPNWRIRKPDGLLPAPPHDETGHTWHHSDKQLFQMTKIGAAALIQDPTYQTAMPIYDGVLSDREIIAVLSYIKSTWPAHVKQHHDRLNGPAGN